MSFSWGEGAEDVYSLFHKGPWGEYGMKLFLFLMDEVTMLLTWYAFFDKGVAICLHSWPEVGDSEYFGGHLFVHRNGIHICLHGAPPSRIELLLL